MGCRTGFYLLLAGDYESADIIPLLQEMFLFIRDYEGEVPGAAARDCGNYLDMNLPMQNISPESSMMRCLKTSATNSLFIRNNPSPQIF